jgi:hypothetical protein
MFRTLLRAAAFYILSRVIPLVTVINVLRIFVIQPFVIMPTLIIFTVTLEHKNLYCISVFNYCIISIYFFATILLEINKTRSSYT